MAFTEADLTAINAALLSSNLEVEINGRRVRYRSTDDLLKIKAMVAQELAASDSSPPNRVYNVNVSKGI